MFYEKDLMSSKSLGKIWRAGNYADVDSADDVSITNVCDKLDYWIDSHHDEVSRRLALRTSAVLINGAARYYKRKIQQLYDDVTTLDREIAFPKRSRYLTDFENFPSSISLTSNEESSTESSKETENTDNTIDSNDLNESSKINEESLINDLEHDNNPDESIRVDKEVQTDSARPSTSAGGFDQTLPYGFVMVHDNYHSRLPTKIIISSLNPDVVKLL